MPSPVDLPHPGIELGCPALQVDSLPTELWWRGKKRASLIAQSVKSPPAMQDMCVWFLGWEDPLEKDMTTHSSIPGLGRSPGEGHDNLLQYSCLESPLDWEAWQATVHGVARVWHDLATKLPSEKKYVQGCHHDGLKGFYVNQKNKEKVAIFENQMQFF